MTVLTLEAWFPDERSQHAFVLVELDENLLLVAIERLGCRDPSMGVSSLLREETLSCSLAGTTASNGPTGTALSMGGTNPTSDT
eukprot:scaffold458_cov424-Pavlova_lutheri.AAC.3